LDAELAARLAELGGNCSITAHADLNGWQRDHCIISDAALPSLIAAYEALLVPDIEEAVEAALADAGIVLSTLLVAPAGGRDEITRSDACELAAVAALLVHDAWPSELLHMPNIPKGSRRKSESGIDIMTTSLEVDGPVDYLRDTEAVYLGSVKHTTTERNDRLVDALIVSLTASLTPEYLACQLRVLDHVVHTHRPTAPRGRLFLVLRDFPRTPHLRLAAVAAVDLSQLDAALAVTRDLPVVVPEVYKFRITGIHGLPELHTLCL
jgi:hypothetical protein